MQERAHLFVTRGRSSGNSRLTRPQQRWAQATVVHAHKPHTSQASFAQQSCLPHRVGSRLCLHGTKPQTKNRWLHSA